jgi:peptidoglycan/LPS O-acetylase OafA/YrhL
MQMGQNQARLKSLDGLRGLAALMVFFHHTLQSPLGGYLGVDLFFVLSGFLISSILIREMQAKAVPDLLRFYSRRAQRLLPAFVLMILLYLCIRFCFGLSEPDVGLRGVFDVLMLSDVRVIVPYLAHCWSLSVEWQFYFAWPGLLTLLVINRIGLSHVAMLAVGAVVVVWIVRLFFHIDIRIDGLLLGSALALISPNVRLPTGRAVQLTAQGILALALLAIVTLMFVSDYAGTHVPTWLGYAGMPLLGVLVLFLITQSSGAISKTVLENSVLVYFGKISYGFYLYHFPVAALMYVHGYSPLSSVIAGLIVCVPLSDFSWRYVELPILRIGASPKLAAPMTA